MEKNIFKTGLLLIFLLFLAGCSTDGPDIQTIDYGNKLDSGWWQGDRFMLNSKIVLNSSEEVTFVGCTNTSDVYFKQMKLATSNGLVNVYFYENITYTGGVDNYGISMDRQLSSTHSLLILTGSTITDYGTLIYQERQNNADRVTYHFVDENAPLLLDKNTCYAYRFVNDGGSNNRLWVTYLWSEN